MRRLVRAAAGAAFAALFLCGAARAGPLPPPGPQASVCSGGQSLTNYPSVGGPISCGGTGTDTVDAGNTTQITSYAGAASTHLVPITPSGDITYAVGGAFTINSGAVTNAKIANSSVTLNTHVLSLGGSLVLGFPDFAGQIAGTQMPALSGDVSSSAGSASLTVTKIQGRAFAATAPTTNQVASFNGTQWGPGAATGASAGSYTCSSVVVDSSGYITSIVSGSCSGGGSVSVTAAQPAIVINPTPGTGTFTVGLTAPVNDQSGGGYTILTGDNTKTVGTGNATYTLAQAGTTGFGAGWSACLLNIGASGNSTINTTTSQFKGASGTSSLTLTPGDWSCPISDGTNYWAPVGHYTGGSGGISGLTAGRLGVAGSPTTLTSSQAFSATPGNSTIVESDSGGTIDAGWLPTTLHYAATSATVTATQWKNGDVFIVTAASQTFTLPSAATLSSGGNITIITRGVTTTLTPNAADGINGLSINTPQALPADGVFAVTTNGSGGSGTFAVPLGPVQYAAISWLPGQNLSAANAMITRVGQVRTIEGVFCTPEVVVGGTATMDFYYAASGTALSAGTKINTTALNANTGANTEQSLGVTNASVPASDRIGFVAAGAGWASSTGAGGCVVAYR